MTGWGMSRRRDMTSFVPICLLLSLGCTAEDRPVPDRSSTLTVLVEPWDHRAVTPAIGSTEMHLVYSALFGPSDGWDPVPGLVRAWEHGDDFREWTYHLRTDVRWHDGVPFTAHDVKFTYDLYQHQSVLRGNPKARTITVLDDSTVTVVRHTRGETPLNDWGVILPRHLLGELDPEHFSEWDAWKRPVGTGPYRFVRYEPRTGIELEANPDYFLGKPEIDRIVLKLSLIHI